MTAFTQGLSGLRSDQKAIEVTSNNIANSNTAGFKSSRAIFGDVYSSIYGGGVLPTSGKGSTILDVDQQFFQGNLTPSGNPLDLGISGDGFFKVQTPGGKVQYTRAGQFGLDPNGFVINSQGDRLQGFALDENTGLPIDNPIDVKVIEDILPPSATASSSIRLNLDARSPAAVNPVFDPLDATSFNNSTSMVIYDDLGRERTLNVYFARRDADTTDNVVDPTWEVRATVDGVPVGVSVQDSGAPFAESGTLEFATGGGLVDPANARFNLDLSDYAAANENFSTTNAVTLDLSSSTQFGAAFIVQDLAQDGYETANFTGFSVNDDGILSYNYSNGEVIDAAQVAVYRFINPDGLRPVGESKWETTIDAGAELKSLNPETNFALVKQGFFEESNVDLTDELVKLIVFQRSYQANSQSIKTQDALLQTATNLRNG